MKRSVSIKTKGFQKRVSLSVVLFQIVFSFMSATRASADFFDIGNIGKTDGSLKSGSFDNVINDSMNSVERRYHLNSNSLANLGETMNVTANKEMVPQMNLIFNPTDPKNGKEITAQAIPLYFSSQPESLYFTWYLKRHGCDLESNLNPNSKDQKVLDKIALCDADGFRDANGRVDITINDWKVQAMRRIANGGFAGDQVNYGASSGDGDEYSAQFGGDKNAGSWKHCYVHNFDGGEDYELGEWKWYQDANGDWQRYWANGCQHLFPQSNVDDTGNGSFGVKEEQFWHTDPKDPSTAQNGNKDEANVVGLNQDKFTWNYASGDEVGVAIEGLSINPTKHQESSMKIMWAFAKNKCTPTGTSQDPIYGGPYTGKADDGGVYSYAVIPTANMDLNTCVKDNLVDPTQGDQSSKFEIQLAASPENPIIDSFSKKETDNRGSILKIQSSFVNSATKESDVSYDWRIYANQKQSAVIDDAWENITEGLTSAHAVSSVAGNDLSALKINLNIDKDTKVNGQNFFDRYFKNDVGYFRINATATENFDVGKRRVGRSSIIVKIVRAKAQIQTHAVTVNKDWKLEFAPSIPAKDTGLLCEDSTEDRSVCPVVKGQIVGLGFDAAALGLQVSSGADITWNINNKPFKCSEAVAGSTDDGCKNGEKNFFPVTGDTGEVYTVTMAANNTLSGKSITLTRIFRVVEPSLLIVSADATNAWPKLLGQYVDSNGDTTDNYSKDVFESFIGKKFSFKGLFYPSSLKNNANVSWSVNGTSVQPDDQGLLTIDDAAQGKQAGSVYTVSLQGTHTPSPRIKKALSDIWGVSIADVTETELSRSIQVEMVQGSDGLAQGPLDSSKKFFASIIAYVPSSVIFFFRLIMTMGLILFTLGIVFSYVPEKRTLS